MYKKCEFLLDFNVNIFIFYGKLTAKFLDWFPDIHICTDLGPIIGLHQDVQVYAIYAQCMYSHIFARIVSFHVRMTMTLYNYRYESLLVPVMLKQWVDASLDTDVTVKCKMINMSCNVQVFYCLLNVRFNHYSLSTSLTTSHIKCINIYCTYVNFFAREASQFKNVLYITTTTPQF